MKFFNEFDFEKLNDFCIEAPYIPITVDMNKYLSTECPYENMVSHEQQNITVTNNKKGKKEHIPSDYDKNWADEF